MSGDHHSYRDARKDNYNEGSEVTDQKTQYGQRCTASRRCCSKSAGLDFKIALWLHVGFTTTRCPRSKHQKSADRIRELVDQVCLMLYNLKSTGDVHKVSITFFASATYDAAFCWRSALRWKNNTITSANSGKFDLLTDPTRAKRAFRRNYRLESSQIKYQTHEIKPWDQPGTRYQYYP